jgi:NADPH:quinone reductase-like Zn-dependent oxidoreductase
MRVLVHGAAGNVGAYAVQLARRAAAEVVPTAHARDVEYVCSLGATRVIDGQAKRFSEGKDRAGRRGRKTSDGRRR